jgi:hypothetical protein
MALPNHTRTWQFLTNQISHTGVTLSGNQTHMLAIKEAFKGNGSGWVDKSNASAVTSGNWTVTSSCNGPTGTSGGGANSFGNNDNVDRWESILDLGWAGGNHSWIVLQQSAIAPKFQVCIDLSQSNSETATIVVSFTAGFGAANGGTDGTASARPTATDQQILGTNMWWGGGNNYGSVWNLLKTDDGYATRLIIFHQGVCAGWWQFEAPDPVVSGWTNPSVSYAVGHPTYPNNLGVIPHAVWKDGTTYHFSKTPGGTIFNSTYVPLGSSNDTASGTSTPELNDLDLGHDFCPMAMWSSTVNARGINGFLVDAFWGWQYGGSGGSGQRQFGKLVHSSGGDAYVFLNGIWVPWVTNLNLRTFV